MNIDFSGVLLELLMFTLPYIAFVLMQTAIFAFINISLLRGKGYSPGQSKLYGILLGLLGFGGVFVCFILPKKITYEDIKNSPHAPKSEYMEYVPDTEEETKEYKGVQSTTYRKERVLSSEYRKDTPAQSETKTTAAPTQKMSPADTSAQIESSENSTNEYMEYRN